MASEISDIPGHIAKYENIDDSTPHITRCPPSLAMHWAAVNAETSSRSRRGSVIRRQVFRSNLLSRPSKAILNIHLSVRTSVRNPYVRPSVRPQSFPFERNLVWR